MGDGANISSVVCLCIVKIAGAYNSPKVKNKRNMGKQIRMRRPN